MQWAIVEGSQGDNPMPNDLAQPLTIKVQITLTENQINVIRAQAKHERRSVSHMIQMLLYEGWMFYVNDHEVYVPLPEHCKEESNHLKAYCNDQESLDLMTPAIPDYV